MPVSYTHLGQLYFENVRVPASYRVDSTAFYNRKVMSFYGAICLGLAEKSLEMTIEYLKGREKYGVSLWEGHESIRNEIAAFELRIRNFRHAVYSHMNNLNEDIIYPYDAYALKVEGGKLAEEVSSACIVFFGGAGVIRETGIERYYRDAKTLHMACGSNKGCLLYTSRCV